MARNRIYRSNPPLGGLHWNGRKTYDRQTGGWTYENFLIADDYGTLVDSRDPNAYDYNDDEEILATSGIQPYLLS
jgi:hypothetical protein